MPVSFSHLGLHQQLIDGLLKLDTDHVHMRTGISEGMRLYPPGPGAIPREVAQGGNTVLGRYLDEGTIISVHHMSTYRSPKNFHEPDRFAPERWLPAEHPVYENDQREVVQPFSYGPRNCIGQNLAWHEMRLILAKMVSCSC